MLILAALAVVVLDQLTKYLVFGRHAELISNFLYIKSVENTGVGFGLFRGSNTAIIFLTLMFIGAVMYYYEKIPKKKAVVVAAAMILGGAVGNLIDRVCLGYVRDFISFSFWPAFNAADAAITIGGIIIIIYLMGEK